MVGSYRTRQKLCQEQIDDQLLYWNKFIIHKCKQRVTKLTEMLKRMRKLRLQELPEIVTIKKKAERREKIRESKAAIAAKHETEIEKELLERLQAGTYGDIYNFNQKAFRKVAEGMEAQEDEDDVSLDEEAEIQALLDQEIVDKDNDVEYVFGNKGDEDDEDEESENDEVKGNAKLGKRKAKRRELEFEEDDDAEAVQDTLRTN